MRRLFLYSILLCSLALFAQSGDGYVNYRSYKTHYGNGSSSTYNEYTYYGLADSSTELEAMLDTNHPGTTLYTSGEVIADSNGGFRYGRAPYWYSEYYAIHHWGWFQPQETGTYVFSLASDDGSALWVDGQLKLFRPCCGTSYVSISLTAGQWYRIDTKWQEYTGGDYMTLRYSPPSASGTYYYVGGNTSTLKITNIEQTNEESFDIQFDLNLNSNISATNLGYKVYYDATAQQNGTEWYNTSTTNATRYVGSDGVANVTDYINEVTTASGKKATTVGGSVEWCVIYDYDSTNKRHRVLIDKREFPSGVTATDVKKLQLFDLWDGDVTYYTDDAYWTQYYIYTDSSFDFTNSTYSSYLRDASGYYGTKAEFTFIDNEVYKRHKISFSSYGNISTFIDDYVTIGDVVAAFSELAGGGINGGYKGDLNGIQLQNADVNLDGKFDFKDTYKLLNFLQGNEALTPNNFLSQIIRVIPQSIYDGTTSSNWSTSSDYFPGTNSTIEFDLNGDKTIAEDYKVAFLGDVNFSHSSTHVEVQLGTSAMNTERLMEQKINLLEVDLDIEKVQDYILVNLTVPQNNLNIVGSEFRIGFDNTRVEYDRLETNSTLNNFDAKRDEYIKIGSISTDGSKNLNDGVEYQIYFKSLKPFDSTLGLVSIIKSEVVDGNANQIQVLIK